MMSSFAKTSAVLFTTVALAACGATPTSPSAVSGGAGRVTGSGGMLASSHDIGPSELGFLGFAADFHRAMRELGNLAQGRGDLFDVTFFGLQLEQTHTHGLEDALDISNERLPETAPLAPQYQDIFNRLSRESGNDFDRVFTEAVVQLLQMGIARFQQQGTASSNEGLRTHIVDFGGKMRTDLVTAQELARRVNGF